jgi:hypothetical protein
MERVQSARTEFKQLDRPSIHTAFFALNNISSPPVLQNGNLPSFHFQTSQQTHAIVRIRVNEH